ncbi:MAG: glycosyltransferase family 9 protein [Acidobacteria bacterium]|nr:glycosyltransferase family 9 protein [Acidobacteriota bacterium]
MFDHLQLSDWRERWAVGLADQALALLAWPARLWPARQRPPAPRAILLLRLERIGDLLMTRDAICAVRLLAPGARIDLVVGSWNEPVARLLPDVNGVEVLDARWLARDREGDGMSALMRRAWAWRGRRYDLAINFEGDVRSNILLWLSGASRRAGFDMAGGGPLLTERVTYNPREHVAVNAMTLVERALGGGQPSAKPVQRRPAGSSRLLLPAEARARAAELLGLQSVARSSFENHRTIGTVPSPAVRAESAESRTAAGPGGGGQRPLVGIHAGGGREIKQWEPARFAEVASALVRSHHARIVLTGSAGDRPLVDRVRALLPPDVQPIDLAGRLDLVSLAAVLERLSVLIIGDTGPMHLAAAVGTRMVALFGPSAPERWGPLTASARILRIDLPCSPCNRIRRPPERCVGHVPDCLAGITVACVTEAAGDMLDAIDAREDGDAR